MFGSAQTHRRASATNKNGTPHEPRTRTKYTYDAFGRRVRKVGSGVPLTTDYAYDLSGNVISEFAPTCSGGTVECLTVGYLYLGGSPIAEYKNSTTYFVQSDHLGSARIITDPGGNGIQSWDYLPYGELLQGVFSIDHLFTSDERDSETNLDHTWFRQYSSQLGRWMHSDPAGLAAVDITNPQSWDRYSHVLNNPLKWVDPHGLCPKWGPFAVNGHVYCTSASGPGEGGSGFGYDDPLQQLVLGYSFWDALLGVPGTYYGFDAYTGNPIFGFSIDLQQTTLNTIDNIRGCVQDPTCHQPGFNLAHDITDPGPYPLYGFGVFVTDYGINQGLSGIIPDLILAQADLNQATALAIQKYHALSPDQQAAQADKIFGALEPLINLNANLMEQLLQLILGQSPM